ncbi:hypothetical protein BDZ94DRAFT_1326111 [Collybia nuda]|uniref:Uncharacterized protein n=1 Tax=Collybia nuda TaxID=64659 RepID=A0A9P6C9X9_9AGAR|nr:hypothetical protein BDZ94DRAFT_1326111 [Collybia nuda]
MKFPEGAFFTERREIPIELLNIIVNLSHRDDDNATLVALSTVSHRFARMAQPLLFSTIRLDPPFYPHSTTNLCQKFHSLICESPHLATCVRHLSIIDGDHYLSAFRNKSPLQNTPTLGWVGEEESLPGVLYQLVNIKHLAIRGSRSWLDWAQLSKNIQRALLDTVQRPTLSSIDVSRTWGFTSLLACATNLKYLTLSKNSPGENEATVPELSPRLLCRPDALDTTIHPIHDFIMLVQNGSWLDFSRLRSLTIRSQGRLQRGCRAFLQTLLRSSTALEHLHIRLPSPSSFRHLTSLAPFLPLRSLYLEIHQNTHTSRKAYSTWLLQLFDAFPDPTVIDTLAFQASCAPKGDLFTPEEYLRFDIALTRPELSSLTSVRLGVVGVGQAEALEYYDKLPMVHARRILSVERDPEWSLRC